MQKNFKKILLIQTAFIGDVILATAALEQLAEDFPETKIDFLLRKGNEGLLKNNPRVNRVLVWDKTRQKNKNLWKIGLQIRQESYDAVINLQRFFSTGLLTAFSGAALRVGFRQNPWAFMFNRSLPHHVAPHIHEVDRVSALASLLFDKPVEPRPAFPRLYPSDQDFERVKPYQQAPYICIAPSSVWFTKQYPKEKWIEFLASLPPSLQVFLLGAPQDSLLCDDIAAQSGHLSCENLCGKLSLLESAALMKKALMNYVNDSAPMHLASATNAPVCALYCSTVPDFGFGPVSQNHSFIIETPQKLDCRPCGLHGKKSCPKGHFLCGQRIENEQLKAVLKEVGGFS